MRLAAPFVPLGATIGGRASPPASVFILDFRAP
jgi:hypothetical protein